MTDRQFHARLDAPAFHRNRQPILDVLKPLLENIAGNALEIGCGSGQHARAFAEAFPNLTVWPSDIEARHRASADAWQAVDGFANHMPAIDLDAAASDWSLGSPERPPNELSLVYAFNVIHISPWTVAEGIVRGAARHLAPDGQLILYGPYKRNGAHTADSNARFDASLRSQDPAWASATLRPSKHSHATAASR